MKKLIWITAMTLAGCSSAPLHQEVRPQPVTLYKPGYPAKAFNQRREGQIRIKYDVDNKGNVINAHVIKARPAGYFEKEALYSLSRWKYEPDKPYQGMTMTIKFTISDTIEPLSSSSD